MPTAVKESELKISQKKTIRRGDRFRVGGGTRYSRLKMPPVRGLFVCRDIYSKTFRGSRRVFIEGVEIDADSGLSGAARTFFVAGKPFTKKAVPGARFIPYTIRPETGEPKKMAGRQSRKLAGSR